MRPTSRQQRWNRKKLLRNSHILSRPADQTDIAWVWAAFKYSNPKATREQFDSSIVPYLAKFDLVWVLEDENYHFQEGQGPVGLVYADYNGWSLMPHVRWFPWATLRNKLRGAVHFLWEHRTLGEAGVIELRSDAQSKRLFDHLGKYLPIRYSGNIQGGRPHGNDFIYSIPGLRKANGTTSLPHVRDASGPLPTLH